MLSMLDIESGPLTVLGASTLLTMSRDSTFGIKSTKVYSPLPDSDSFLRGSVPSALRITTLMKIQLVQTISTGRRSTSPRQVMWRFASFVDSS